nr:putative reverse transcriptase domain-containing protein [Tanacetum cinerariifolium]
MDTLSLLLCLLGLTNAPTVFIDLMNQVCKPYLDKLFFIVFIDDILIYLKSKEDHEVHLKLVLELLKNEKWTRRLCSLLRRVKLRIRLCTHAKRQGEAFKVENATVEMLCGLDQLMERKEDGGMYFLWVPLKGDVRTLIMDEAHASRVLANIVEILRDAIGYKYGLSSSEGWTKCQVLLKVSPWKGKLAPRHVGPFEILEKICHVAYHLRLQQEFSDVHDTFHVSNLKKCLADANLHVLLGEVMIDKTLLFVKEPIVIMDREVKILKHSRISIVKFHWNLKRGHENFIKTKYPRLLVEQAIVEREDTNQPSPPPIAPPEASQMVSSEVILNGNGEVKMTKDEADEYLARFHGIKDAKTLWTAIKTRFGDGLDKGYDRFQRLLSLLEIHKAGSSGSSSNSQNVAFVSTESTSSTNELNAAYSVSTATCHSTRHKLDNEDLEKINQDDLEEMDLKWQLVETKPRLSVLTIIEEGTLPGIAKQPRIHETRVEMLGMQGTEKEILEEAIDFALMAFTSNPSSSSSSNSEGHPQQALKNKGIVDSGCSRHMTRNKSYLASYQEINDGGFVAFGSSRGKITGKGKIRIEKLEFDGVYFVNELKFNLFSVLQMCDKKNSVLFTKIECLVLSLNFKLFDESQVLVIIPRQSNLYSFELQNVVPSGDLTCLFAKASIDESNL